MLLLGLCCLWFKFRLITCLLWLQWCIISDFVVIDYYLIGWFIWFSGCVCCLRWCLACGLFARFGSGWLVLFCFGLKFWCLALGTDCVGCLDVLLLVMLVLLRCFWVVITLLIFHFRVCVVFGLCFGFIWVCFDYHLVLCCLVWLSIVRFVGLLFVLAVFMC